MFYSYKVEKELWKPCCQISCGYFAVANVHVITEELISTSDLNVRNYRTYILQNDKKYIIKEYKKEKSARKGHEEVINDIGINKLQKVIENAKEECKTQTYF